MTSKTHCETENSGNLKVLKVKQSAFEQNELLLQNGITIFTH